MAAEEASGGHPRAEAKVDMSLSAEREEGHPTRLARQHTYRTNQSTESHAYSAVAWTKILTGLEIGSAGACLGAVWFLCPRFSIGERRKPAAG